MAPAAPAHPAVQLKLAQRDTCQPVKYKQPHGHDYHSSKMHNSFVPLAGGDNVVFCVKCS